MDRPPNQDLGLIRPPNQINHQQQPPPPQHQPQRCPRCESMNTKFCYYNNYSLSQPRYFCKTCRRYWTQGGTLRNVPVGGGCRKGKRAKPNSSSSSSSSSSSASASSASRSLPPPQPQPQQIQALQENAAMNAVRMPAGATAQHYNYPGAGFLASSYAGIQALNQSQPFNGAGTSSNMNLQMQGFNFSRDSFEVPLNQQRQFYQPPNLYPSDQEGLGMVVPSTRPSVGAADTAMWATTTATNATSGGGQSLNPIQWPDLPGPFGPAK